MRSSLQLKDRIWLDLKIYRKSFLGSDAIAWLTSELNGDVDAALEKGNALIEMGYCYHVCRAHYFEVGGGTLYYYWNEDVLRAKGTSEEMVKMVKMKKRVERVEDEREEMERSVNEALFRVVVLEERLRVLENLVVAGSIVVVGLIGVLSLGLNGEETLKRKVLMIFFGAGVSYAIYGKMGRDVASIGGELETSESYGGEGSAERGEDFLVAKAMRRKVTGIFKAAEAPIEQREVVPAVETWPHRPIFICDDRSGSLPLGVPFEFETELFKGKCLIRIRGVKSDDEESDAKYFEGRQRRFQAIVQGQFKEEIPLTDLLTGHAFARPLKNLPPKWLLGVAERLIKRLAPSTVVELRKKANPRAFSLLGATSQVLRIDQPGQEPDIRHHDIEEENSCLGGKFSSGKVTSMRRKKRLTSHSKGLSYDTKSVYTFDFYQHLLDASQYELDLGVKRVKLANALDGQPLQILAVTRDGREAWKFQLWHEALLRSETAR
ncbi:hypothetical protein TrST_g8968 [Triparma strigata]|nr:hypothetical protein TrST_g8968 [Triparma strigata]